MTRKFKAKDPDPLRDFFVKAFLDSLPKGWAKDEFSTNRAFAEIIGKAVTATIRKVLTKAAKEV